jgi:hypothetical protein
VTKKSGPKTEGPLFSVPQILADHNANAVMMAATFADDDLAVRMPLAHNDAVAMVAIPTMIAMLLDDDGFRVGRAGRGHRQHNAKRGKRGESQ